MVPCSQRGEKYAVDSTARFVLITALVTLGLFAWLMAEPLGLFSIRSPATPEPAAGQRPPAVLPADSAREVTSPRVPADPPPENFSPSGPADITRISELQVENERLVEANRDLEQRLTAVLNWILANFRGKFPLPEKHLGDVQLKPLTEEFLLSPELADLFSVTGEEELLINDAFAYAHDYLRDIEDALMTVTNPRPGKVILHLPTFEEYGQLLQEDLYAALETTLGGNRFDRFLEVSEKNLRESFYEFGEASRTMVFELVYVGDDPYPQLKIKDGYIIEIGPNARSVTATEAYVTNLPSEYYAYVQWLPGYMADYAAE